MKILSASQIREIDVKTMMREPISSIDLMERAAKAFTDWFLENYYRAGIKIVVFCGVGNNGGDGFAIARLLHARKCRVSTFLMPGTALSEECAINLRRARQSGVAFNPISTGDEFLGELQTVEVIVDAILGTGLSRELSDIAVDVIAKINGSRKPVISVDVPSGLFLDRKTSFAIRAADTVTFQLPKLALLLPDNHTFAGDVHLADIGLDESSIAEAATDMFFTAKADVRGLLKPLPKFAHKGTQGHALIVGGSVGKIGSVCLASKAALRSGCGLVTAFVPKCGLPVIQSCFPEAMAIPDKNEECISNIQFNIQPDAIAMGMGMGTCEESQAAFRRFLSAGGLPPLIIDADGLNILAENKDWLALLPPRTILTPHPKELSRLIGGWDDDFEKIAKVRLFAQKYNLVVVVKGAYSLVVDSSRFFVNGSGTPALATAGSGDVLSGIIAGLLAQGYAPTEAARLGVFLHGFTADVTAKKIYPRSFIATDIIEHIGNAYFEIEK